MKLAAIALVSSALLSLAPFAAKAKDDASSADSSAIIVGRVSCFTPPEGTALSLTVEDFLGVDGRWEEVNHAVSGTCATALAALRLPGAPLCVVEGSVNGPFPSLHIACSGPADRVIDAFGKLTKAVLTLP